MATDERTARMNEIILARADSIYMLIDSSKLGQKSFVSYASINIATALITDKDIDPEFSSSLREAGVRVIVAET